MRFAIVAATCIVALVLSLTTAFPTHDRVRRGPVPDLSGLSGICLFPPCNGPSFVFPEIDWEALHASIAQWNKEQEQLSLQEDE
ncbi:unnamed protein product [Rotaria sordida]|uniref:Uncharacterized protein n=1 Tax=Rotaria sordida TaxID=392033 RepID=A0A818NQR4_9BILA|nr:unnamed protein product [Rotaria sordida]CAF1508510.1 unnamed protein product [Rotaria sordida]CAF1535088.1 unnamed protein product [Rotaria sordida]CAF3610699.1 unnamed protein product [Rotaria sordida]CAF4080177.1 unnamed protein product [Rotaria sordida]